MRDDVRALLSRAGPSRVWRGLLVGALGALGCVALATMLGNGAVARTFGTLAWVAALAGAIAGLLSGGGLEERPER